MLLELDRVEKRFGTKKALREVSFQVAEGEVVALAGKNGAGKTTILRLLMGFLAVSDGRIAILGEDPLTRLHVGRVGWMSEQPAFPSAYRVSELIRFQVATFPSWDEPLG